MRLSLTPRTMSTAAFRDKVVLLTGASSGIGRALATQFARHGAHVALVARNAAKLHALESELAAFAGWRLVAATDVRVPEQVNAAVAAVLDRWGRIDVLINNAGKGQASTVENTSLQEFRDIFDTNFFGPLHLLHAALPHMIRRRCGLIIQISSLNGFCAVPYGSAYSASKFALEAVSQSLRIELRPHNIRVLVVRPGVTDTQFFDNARHFRAVNPFPLRHMMNADRVAQKILRAAARNRAELVLTAEGKLLWWLQKFSPRLVDYILSRYVKPLPAVAAPGAAA